MPVAQRTDQWGAGYVSERKFGSKFRNYCGVHSAEPVHGVKGAGDVLHQTIVGMRPECYGKIFPDMLNFTRNKVNQGHVFGATVQSFGLGVQDRKMSVDFSVWEKCLACPEYRTCFDLSLGKLIFQEAVLGHC
jgi:hypothetical protein